MAGRTSVWRLCTRGYGLLSMSNGSLGIKHQTNTPSFDSRPLNVGDARCDPSSGFSFIIFPRVMMFKRQIKIQYSFVQRIYKVGADFPIVLSAVMCIYIA